MPTRVPAIAGGKPLFHEAVYVTRPRVPSIERLSARLATVLDSGQLTNNGPLVRELESRLAEHLGAGFCLATANATIGLQLALRALDLKGKVITTPFTFPATVHAIEWNGLEPVFCDIDPDTYNIAPLAAAELVDAEVSALLPVHVFGNPCDVDALSALAKQHDLQILYDAAHVFGVEHAGRPIADYGDLSVMSFHATKLFHTAEGGALLGRAPELRRAAALLRNFGIVNEDEVAGVGLNGKMSELHAALGLEVLPLIEEEIAGRRAVSEAYSSVLKGVDGLRFQAFDDRTVRNYAYFSIEIDGAEFGLSRDELHRALVAENVAARKYFHPLASENTAYCSLPSAAPERLPNAHRLAARVLTLPIFGELPAAHAVDIATCILELRQHADAVRRNLK